MNYCFRHPTHIAKRKCYQCGKYICPKCQFRGKGHIFCSQTCLKTYGRKQKLNKAITLVKKPLPFWVIRSLFYAAILVFIMIAISLIRNISYITMTEQYIEEKVSYLGQGIKLNSSSDITIIKPANGAKVSSSIITIEGEGKKCSIVALYINGELIKTTTTNSPLFYFKDVSLTKRENIIQAKCFSDYGNVYSNAIIVYYIYEKDNFNKLSYNQLAEDNLLRGNLFRKEIALTFDGGSRANLAEDILKILKRYSLTATFFLTGKFIESYPEIVKKIVNNGHEVGNHTYSHPHLTTYSLNKKQLTLDNVSKEFVIEELKKADEVFYKIVGKHMSPFWRSPYGENNAEIRKWAAEIGYTHVGWTSGRAETLDTLDWISNDNIPLYKTSQQIVEQILSFGKETQFGANGGIILMHLGSERKDNYSTEIIPAIIEGYFTRGYKFVLISQMLNHKDDIIIPNGN